MVEFDGVEAEDVSLGVGWERFQAFFKGPDGAGHALGVGGSRRPT